MEIEIQRKRLEMEFEERRLEREERRKESERRDAVQLETVRILAAMTEMIKK